MCLDHLWVPVRSLGPGPRASFVLKRIGPGLSTCSLASRRRNAGEPLARLPLAFTQGGGNKKWERAVRRGGGAGRAGGWVASERRTSTGGRHRSPTSPPGHGAVDRHEKRPKRSSLCLNFATISNPCSSFRFVPFSLFEETAGRKNERFLWRISAAEYQNRWCPIRSGY